MQRGTLEIADRKTLFSTLLSPRGKNSQDFLQTLSDVCHLRTCLGGEWQSNLVFVRFYFFAELRSRPGDCEAILVEKLFNTQHVLHVTPPVHPLPGAALHRFQLWEFGLPESKHIRRQTAKTRNFAYPEIELFWNQYFSGFRFSNCLFLRSHSRLLGDGMRIKKNCRTRVSSTMCGLLQPEIVESPAGRASSACLPALKKPRKRCFSWRPVTLGSASAFSR